MESTFSRDLALVGAGYWGKNLARNFNALGALHTLCDSSEATLAQYGDEYSGVRRTGKFDEVLKSDSIRKVVIAAPATLHYELAKAAIGAGKDVFVEKPLCLDLQQGEELVELAEKRGCVLMVGHLLQYHPYIQQLKTLLAKGDLGKLQYITSNRLNLGKVRTEENALWSFAPHDLSVVLALTGNQLPQAVRCTGGTYLTSGVPDTTLTTLKFADGVRAHVFVTWLNPFKEQKLTVIGSHGMAVFDDTRPWNEKLVLYRDYLTWKDGHVPVPNKAAAEPVTCAESEPLTSECVHFLECCRARCKPRTDGEEGLRVLRVLKAAQASLELDGEAVSAGKARLQLATLEYDAHPTAIVADGALVGRGTKIWHFSHVMKGAELGENCNLGQNVVVSPKVKLGRNVKVQNNVSIYTGTTIEDDVFLGPSCVLTNVTNPRSQVNRHNLYEKIVIRRGATIGANATIVCGITLGRYSFISAGAVVTKDVPDYALMVGLPARQAGWMSRHGHLLKPAADGSLRCPESGYRYQETSPGVLRCLDLDEEAPLPPELSKGEFTYDHFKARSGPDGHFARVNSAGPE